MYCWNCGKEMDDDLIFCPHCAMKQAGVPEEKPRRKLPFLPIFCAVICIAALLGMVLILMLAQQEPPKPVDPYSVELPDLASFLNTQYTNDDVSAYTHHVTCTMKKDPGLDAAREFLELLQQPHYQLKLDESRSYTQSNNLCTDYIFHYTGKGEGIKWVPHKAGYRYHAKVSVCESTVKDKVTVIFYTSPGFELADPGVDAKAVQ